MKISPIQSFSLNRISNQPRKDVNNLHFTNQLQKDSIQISFGKKEENAQFEVLEKELADLAKKGKFDLDNIQATFDKNKYDVKISPVEELKGLPPRSLAYIKTYFLDNRAFDEEKLEYTPVERIIYLNDKLGETTDEIELFSDVVHEATHLEQSLKKNSLFDLQSEYLKKNQGNEKSYNTIDLMHKFQDVSQSMLKQYSQENFQFAFFGAFDKKECVDYFKNTLDGLFVDMEEATEYVDGVSYDKEAICEYLNRVTEVELEAYGAQKDAIIKHFGQERPDLYKKHIQLYDALQESIKQIKK